ncbi:MULTISPECIES: N-acetylglucosamine kinase [unclassified Microbacterium]|uniref:N-acetylglucosamine kinase n=1 Tax=unclassified Microbacterium TaxID=2609290 RepID=UPI002CE78E3E|nr:BadF/BadG/BcrA/BcrD ATPase family protein [Microbacterium sp.]HWK78383.1 BadF/BadG/BcrA/BcrD ATPase family protein [Microbacterium sp.]
MPQRSHRRRPQRGIRAGMNVVGVDIGGTKTRIALAAQDPAGGTLRDVVVSSASWRGPLGDPEADAVGLVGVLVEQLGDSVKEAPIVVGAHGCDSTEQCHDLERALGRRLAGEILVLNDSELMSPAMGLPDAVGVVVGTGSIATARTVGGELLTAGGWGWLIGDEGSAPALVREAVRAVLTHLDDASGADPLVTRLLAAFSVRDGAELALVATQTASAEAWGARAPEVFTAATEGSVLAAAVISRAGSALAGLVAQLRRRGVPARDVVAGGAVIEAQSLLQGAVRAALELVTPEVTLHILRHPPVTGAIALARRLGGGHPSTINSNRSTES